MEETTSPFLWIQICWKRGKLFSMNRSQGKRNQNQNIPRNSVTRRSYCKETFAMMTQRPSVKNQSLLLKALCGSSDAHSEWLPGFSCNFSQLGFSQKRLWDGGLHSDGFHWGRLGVNTCKELRRKRPSHGAASGGDCRELCSGDNASELLHVGQQAGLYTPFLIATGCWPLQKGCNLRQAALCRWHGP